MQRSPTLTVSDLTIVNKEGETKDWFGKTKQYTIIVNEQKKETVQEIKTLEELKTVGQNKYTKYVLKNDIDAVIRNDRDGGCQRHLQRGVRRRRIHDQRTEKTIV